MNVLLKVERLIFTFCFVNLSAWFEDFPIASPHPADASRCMRHVIVWSGNRLRLGCDNAFLSTSMFILLLQGFWSVFAEINPLLAACHHLNVWMLKSHTFWQAFAAVSCDEEMRASGCCVSNADYSNQAIQRYTAGCHTKCHLSDAVYMSRHML